MILKFKKSKLLNIAALFIMSTGLACNFGTKEDAATDVVTDTVPVKDTVKVPEVVIRPVHPYFNSVMNYISGRKGAEITFEIDTAFFTAYSNELDKNIASIENNRLSKVRNWYSQVLKTNSRNDSLPVFYPFSGGDFIHLNTMYPNAKEYVMMAIEKVGYLPDLDSLSTAAKDSLLKDVNYNMRDVVNKSYFITHNMHTDLRSKKFITGMILPIFWGLGVTNHEILDVQDASLDTSGSVVLAPINEKVHNFEKGVHIVFRLKGDTVEKTLTYFKVDISDKGFESNPSLPKYLAAKTPYNSFLKAASYLPHYRNFEGIRRNILDKSSNHVQDDTGIPYKYFTKDTFIAKVYGNYTKPVADFSSNLYQNDLAAAYRDSTIYGGRLSFSMGYHWGSSEQNIMVFMRK